MRIDQAGIRLAGELNRLLKDAVIIPELNAISKSATSPELIVKAELKDIATFVGRKVNVIGQVYSIKDIGSMVLVNLGAAYPNQILTVVLKGEAKQIASNLPN